MKRFIVFILLTVFGQYVYGQDSLVVMFWNVENFFDHVDQGTGSLTRSFLLLERGTGLRGNSRPSVTI